VQTINGEFDVILIPWTENEGQLWSSTVNAEKIEISNN
jgi:hypothetical protein